MKKIIEFIFKKLGYLKFDNWQEINTEITNLREDNKVLVNRNTQLITGNDQLMKQIKALPYEFDILIDRYSIGQINALEYKLINIVRNNPAYREYLDVWINRLINAKETLQSGSTINIKD